MQAIETNYKNRRREELWSKFKADYPVLSKNIKDKKGIEIISGCVDDGKKLDIIDNVDIIRFSALAFLPEKIRHDDWLSSIIIRILHNENLSAKERLSFLFDNVIDKKYIL